MLKRMLAIMLMGMLVTMTGSLRSVNAQSVQVAGRDDPRAATARRDILKLGVGEDAKVEVKLRDNSKLKGYIGEAKEDSFTVVDSKNSSNQTVRYTEVEKVKKAKGGFSMSSWMVLGAAVAGAVATWVIVKPALCDGGAQTRGPC